MKPTYSANASTSVKSLRFGEHTCQIYEWQAPDGLVILVHMIMPCPNCGFPITLSANEFNVESQSLSHKIICPGRWKSVVKESFGGSDVSLTELDEKGKPIIRRCGYQGLLQEGIIKDVRK